MKLKTAVRLALPAALLLGAGTLDWAKRGPRPPDLEDLILGPAKVPYSGHLRFTHTDGARHVVKEAQVYFEPPNRYLEEFLGTDGASTKLIVSDGEHDEVYTRKSGKLVSRSVALSRAAAPDPARRWSLIVRNYRVRLGGLRTIAGRAAWAVELTPKAAGKPCQSLLIDRETGIILYNRRYLPGSSYSSSLSFSAFQPNHVDPSIFQVEGRLPPATAPASLSPSSRTDLAMVRDSDFPSRLPAGFILQAEAKFLVQGRSWVRHARYSDGLSFLSIFQTDRPVDIPKATFKIGSEPVSPELEQVGLRNFATTLQVSRGKRYFLLISDASPKLLSTVAAALPN